MPPPEDKNDVWWCDQYAGDGTVLAMRRHVLERKFVEETVRMAKEWPALSSSMLALSQYWNDSADDEVHVDIFASDRRTPDWPHICGSEEPSRDLCSECGELVGYLEWGNGELTPPFEAYCHERGDQEQEHEANCRPYAIARKNERGEFDVELVGRIVRPWLDMPRELPSPAPLDDIARALLDHIVERRDEIAARHMLADHWLERGDVRGQYLALALYEHAAQEHRDQMFELWAEHHRAWLGVLAPFIPRGGVTFDRGVLTRAELYVSDELERRFQRSLDDFAAFAALRELRFLPGSKRHIGPAMRRLSVLGPLDDAALAELVLCKATFGVEDLEVELERPSSLAMLDYATNLPRLERLRVRGATADVSLLRGLRRLRELKLLEVAGADDFRVLAANMTAVRWPIPVRVVQLDTDSHVAEGWAITVAANAELARIERTALTPETSLYNLERAVAGLPRDLRLELDEGVRWDPRNEDCERVFLARRGST